jgi:hypothetical protein
MRVYVIIEAMKGGDSMDQFIENLLTNPNEISFAVLFFGLFVWVMKTNNGRELRYQETIQKLTDALGDVEIIKTMIENISDKFIKEEKE